MNDRKDNNIPECLYPGDPRACMLLGAQKKPAEDKKIRRSCFVHVLYIKGQYLLFHTLTRKILLLEPKYIDYFADDRLFPSSVLEEEFPTWPLTTGRRYGFLRFRAGMTANDTRHIVSSAFG